MSSTTRKIEYYQTVIEYNELRRLKTFEYKYNKLIAFNLKNRLKLKQISKSLIDTGSLLTELEDVLDSIDELKETKPKPKNRFISSDSESEESESESETEREEAKPIDFSNDDWKKPRTICVLPYNKEPSGTVEYYGDGNDFYVDELKRTYKNIVFPVGRVSTRRYKLHCDVFINKGFPKWMYYADSKHKVIGVEKVCYSDEDDDPDSNTPVNDLRDEFITHYLF
jgi:hypothetical protein